MTNSSVKISDIPSVHLKKSAERVSFALRRMETIYLESGGKPDKPHRHEYYTVLWSESARGRHIIDFTEYEIEPGTIFFVAPGQVHQVLTEENPVGTVILFTREFLHQNHIREQFIEDLHLFKSCKDSSPLTLSKESDEKLREFADRMEALQDSKAPYLYEAIGAYLKLFLIECHRFADDDVSEGLQGGAHIIREFKALVEQNFRTEHKVNSYAEQLFITSGHLNETIKRFLGKNAKAYISERLILEAKRMAVFTNLSAKEIGYDLGFEDPSHFSKFFKKETGLNLTGFRKKNT